jgi:hypothetical protein
MGGGAGMRLLLLARMNLSGWRRTLVQMIRFSAGGNGMKISMALRDLRSRRAYSVACSDIILNR